MDTLIPYDRSAAVCYANRYAFKRNPRFYDFTNLGGNCTNFVSQCLLAGGMPQNVSYPLGWYYKSLNNRSPSFTGVEFLYNFLTRKQKSKGPVAHVVSVDKLQLGDIVQLSFDGISFRHSLLVTQLNSDNPYDPYLSTNTYDALNRPLSWYTFKAIRGLHVVGGTRV